MLWRRFLAVLLLMPTLLVGCQTFGGAASSEAMESALRERVESRWDAVLAVDFDKVYTFATPAYRKTYDLRHFHNQYAVQVQRTGAEVREIDFMDDTFTTAKVIVMLSFQTTGFGSGVIDGVSRIEETWVRENGKWWFVEPR